MIIKDMHDSWVLSQTVLTYDQSIQNPTMTVTRINITYHKKICDHGPPIS